MLGFLEIKGNIVKGIRVEKCQELGVKTLNEKE